MLKISIPFPNKNVFPNKIRSNHWSVSREAIKKARWDAYYSAREVGADRFKRC